MKTIGSQQKFSVFRRTLEREVHRRGGGKLNSLRPSMKYHKDERLSFRGEKPINFVANVLFARESIIVNEEFSLDRNCCRRVVRDKR